MARTATASNRFLCMTLSSKRLFPPIYGGRPLPDRSRSCESLNPAPARSLRAVLEQDALGFQLVAKTVRLGEILGFAGRQPGGNRRLDLRLGDAAVAAGFE